MESVKKSCEEESVGNEIVALVKTRIRVSDMDELINDHKTNLSTEDLSTKDLRDQQEKEM